MEDWLKCQISPLVKYRQKTKTSHYFNSIILTFQSYLNWHSHSVCILYNYVYYHVGTNCDQLKIYYIKVKL